MPRSLFDLSTPQPFETLADLLATTALPDGQLGVVEGSDDVLYMWSAFFNEQFGQGWLELATTTRATAWHTGSGAPTSDIGNENDFYVDEANGDVYEKTFQPIVPTLKMSEIDTISGTSFTTTASLTPSNDTLYLAAVMMDGVSPTSVDTLTGCGLTWVRIDGGGGGTDRPFALFRGMESSGLSAGTLTGTGTTGTSFLTYAIHVVEFTQTVTGGSHGDTAIVQSNTGSGTGSAVVSLDPFSDPSHNATFACFETGAGGTRTADDGYTYDQLTVPTGAVLLSEWVVAADSSPSISASVGVHILGVAVEVAANPNVTWSLVGSLASSPTPAVSQSQPSDPTGIAAASGEKMLGLAGSITPEGTQVEFQVSGSYTNTNAGNDTDLQLRYGTGTAPTNGAAPTGTAIGSKPRLRNAAIANYGFALQAIVTGLTPGTAYWFDVACTASANTSTVKQVSMTAKDIA